MNLLRRYCPALQSDSLQDGSMSERLAALKTASARLKDLLRSKDHSVGDVLRHVQKSGLAALDERLERYVESIGGVDGDGDDKHGNAESSAIRRYLACPAKQTRAYRTYIENESPFATQQGIKGAEYEHVLVVLDDDEGKEHNQFSYDKYFGVKALSDTDRKNQVEGKDTVVDRTRRLFYVCCSRALQDLVVVWFANDVGAALEAVKRMELFDPESVLAPSDTSTPKQMELFGSGFGRGAR